MIIHQRKGQLTDLQYRVNLSHEQYILLILFDKDLNKQ